jgi:hypothetical protein
VDITVAGLADKELEELMKLRMMPTDNHIFWGQEESVNIKRNAFGASKRTI